MSIPIGAPLKFMRGATVAWRVRSTDYPAGGAYTLNVAFASQSDKVQVTGSDYGDGTYLVELDSTTSLAFVEDHYKYQERVDDGVNFHFIGRGAVRILENLFEISDGHDGRSDAAVMYDKLTELLKQKADADQSQMSHQDQSISRYQWEDLQQQRGYYAHQMTDDERMARGFKPRLQKRARFIR